MKIEGTNFLANIAKMIATPGFYWLGGPFSALIVQVTDKRVVYQLSPRDDFRRDGPLEIGGWNSESKSEIHGPFDSGRAADDAWSKHYAGRQRRAS